MQIALKKKLKNFEEVKILIDLNIFLMNFLVENTKSSYSKALIADTNLILADEPTGNLDFKTSKEIFSFLKLKKLKKQ